MRDHFCKGILLWLAILSLAWLPQASSGILPLVTVEADFEDNLPATHWKWFQSHSDPIAPLPAIESTSAVYFAAHEMGSDIVVRIRVFNPNTAHSVYADVRLLDPEFVHAFDSGKNTSLSGEDTYLELMAPLEYRDFYFT